jgi:hypothetical protein
MIDLQRQSSKRIRGNLFEACEDVLRGDDDTAELSTAL